MRQWSSKTKFKRRYFSIWYQSGQWTIGVQQNFVMDGYSFVLFGLTFFVPNEFWWMLRSKKWRPTGIRNDDIEREIINHDETCCVIIHPNDPCGCDCGAFRKR